MLWVVPPGGLVGVVGRVAAAAVAAAAVVAVRALFGVTLLSLELELIYLFL